MFPTWQEIGIILLFASPAAILVGMIVYIFRWVYRHKDDESV